MRTWVRKRRRRLASRSARAASLVYIISAAPIRFVSLSCAIVLRHVPFPFPWIDPAGLPACRQAAFQRVRCSRVGHFFRRRGHAGPPLEVEHPEPGREGRRSRVELRPPRRARAAPAGAASGDRCLFNSQMTGGCSRVAVTPLVVSLSRPLTFFSSFCCLLDREVCSVTDVSRRRRRFGLQEPSQSS